MKYDIRIADEKTQLETFRHAYREARELERDHDRGPVNPVVRRLAGGTWKLESELLPEADATHEIDLEVFNSYFYDVYKDDGFEPDMNDVMHFQKNMEE